MQSLPAVGSFSSSDVLCWVILWSFGRVWKLHTVGFGVTTQALHRTNWSGIGLHRLTQMWVICHPAATPKTHRSDTTQLLNKTCSWNHVAVGIAVPHCRAYTTILSPKHILKPLSRSSVLQYQVYRTKK